MRMRFHHLMFFVPTDDLIPLAKAVDEIGYDGICVSDHLFTPRELASLYPDSDDGAPRWSAEAEFPDVWCAISAMAACTERVTFTTAIYVAATRELLSLAKAAGTAAYLSSDRVNFGVGAGWCREEFAATGQRFEGRGARLDDMITALRALWSGGWVEYRGPHCTVPAMQMNPAPREPIPILGGGYSDAALRRAVTLCDGWIGVIASDIADAKAQVDRVLAARAETGRDQEQGFRIFMGLDGVPEPDHLRLLADYGVTDFTVAPDLSYGYDLKSARGELSTRVDLAKRFFSEIINRLPE